MIKVLIFALIGFIALVYKGVTTNDYVLIAMSFLPLAIVIHEGNQYIKERLKK